MVDAANTQLVSVIIPAYNSEKFIEAAINSVLAQSYQNFEIIVVDDSSNDNTKRIVETISQKDKRVAIHKIPHSGRPSVTRNYGIKKAQGSLIAFLDSDDLWSKEKLEKQIKLINTNPELIFVYSMSITFGDVNLLSRQYELLPLPIRAVKTKEDLLKIGNTIPLSSVLVRSDILEEIGRFDEDPELQIEDYDLWIRLSQKGKFKFMPRILVYYRIHSQQFSADWETKKKRLEYLAQKRNLKLPEYNYFRNKNIFLLFIRNIIHFKFYLLYKLIGFFDKS